MNTGFDDPERPHRPNLPPNPGWAQDPSMGPQQESAIKLFAYNNAQLRNQGAQNAGQDRQELEAAAKKWAGPYQDLKNEHEAHSAEIAARAEQIKAEHGVRVAGDLHQRGLSDGQMIEGAVNAFATDAATNGLQSADIQAMAAADYDKALTSATAQAQAEREEAARMEAAVPTQAEQGVSAAHQERAPTASTQIEEDFSAYGGELTEARAQRFARLAETMPSQGTDTPSAGNDGTDKPSSSAGMGE